MAKGVIDTIEEILLEAGRKQRPVTVNQIAEQLAKRVKGHEPDALRSTVAHQIYYLPKQRGLSIERVKEGRTCFYSARIAKKPSTSAKRAKKRGAA